jgi:hypothetical protein
MLPADDRPEHAMARWKRWLAECTALQEAIVARHGGQLVDTRALWEQFEADPEARDQQTIGLAPVDEETAPDA